MGIKKYNLLIAMLLFCGGAFAQAPKSTSGYDVYDTSVVTNKRMPQQNEFWNHNYNFPSKPRNMWEVGVSGGSFNVVGDVDSKFPSFGFAAHVRKAFGYLFSVRLQYMYGVGYGQSWLASENYQKNKPLSSLYSAIARDASGNIITTIPGRAAEVVYYNYKNNTQDLSLEGIFTFNNIRFHKNKTKFVMYVGGGFGASAYDVKINALNDKDNNNTYSALYAQAFAVPFEHSNKKWR